MDRATRKVLAWKTPDEADCDVSATAQPMAA